MKKKTFIAFIAFIIFAMSIFFTNRYTAYFFSDASYISVLANQARYKMILGFIDNGEYELAKKYIVELSSGNDYYLKVSLDADNEWLFSSQTKLKIQSSLSQSN